MTAAQKAAAKAVEADRAAIAFHIALTQIGVGTLEEAMALWSDVNPTKIEATAARWLDRAVFMVMSRRSMSRDLAFAYYRLARALRTGSTIADPYHPLKANPTLNDLRDEFAGMVDDMARVAGSVPEPAQVSPVQNVPPEDTPPTTQEPATVPDDPDDDEQLLIEELEDLREEEARLDAAAEEEARIVLEALGPNNLASKVSDFDTEMTAVEMDAAREAAHAEAAARQAAAAERVVLNGGRSTLWSLGQQDKRCIGYIRVSRTGTPCGFCAMLISRGLLLKYKSKKGAETRFSDGDLYHDNCHCYAEQVFSEEHYQGDMFALNRRYELEWPIVTKGYGGVDALNAWRRYINAQHRAEALTQ